jgi:hypothetical protein
MSTGFFRGEQGRVASQARRASPLLKEGPVPDGILVSRKLNDLGKKRNTCYTIGSRRIEPGP